MPAISVIAIIIAAAVAGGTALVATHGQDVQQLFQKVGGSVSQLPNVIPQIHPASQPSANLTKVSPSLQTNQSKSITKSFNGSDALVIVNSQIYTHVISHVTIKNNGTDALLVHQVSYGQYSVLTGDFILTPGKQEQINMTGVTGNSGSSYLLQVSGKGVKSGTTVVADQIIGLQEPITNLQVVNASIYIAKVQYPAITLALHNAGMDSVSVTGIGLNKSISSQFWAHGQKAIVLLPNETTLLNFQLDSYDYINSTLEQSQGLITYSLPITGGSVTVHITGSSSTGHAVSVNAKASVKNDYKPVVQLSTATIKIENAIIKVNPANGHSTVTMTFRNNSTHPVVVRSIAFSGSNIPLTHWSIPGNFVINISTTNTLTLTDPAGISTTDIGTWFVITATGQYYSGSAIDSGTTEGIMVYATSIAQATT